MSPIRPFVFACVRLDSRLMFWVSVMNTVSNIRVGIAVNGKAYVCCKNHESARGACARR